MCNQYSFVGDPTKTFQLSTPYGEKTVLVEHDESGHVITGWPCLCTLNYRYTNDFGVGPGNELFPLLAGEPQSSISKSHSSSESALLPSIIRRILIVISSLFSPICFDNDNTLNIGTFMSTPIRLLGYDNPHIASANRTYDGASGDIASEECADLDTLLQVSNTSSKELMSREDLSQIVLQSDDEVTSSYNSDERTESVISDAEVQDRLLEPGLTIELERQLLRKPKTAQYPFPRGFIRLYNASADGKELFPEEIDERIFTCQKILYMEDPLGSLWEIISKKVACDEERISEKRTEGTLDPFVFLNHRKDFTQLLNDPLASDDKFPAELKAAIIEQWGRLAERYGEFDLLQNEQRIFVDKFFSILFNYQEAVANQSLVTKDAIASLLCHMEEAMLEFLAVEYGVRKCVIEDLLSDDE